MKYYWLLINDFNLIGLKLIRKKKYLYDEFECGLKILLLTKKKKSMWMMRTLIELPYKNRLKNPFKD